ncbi:MULTISPECIES: flagellar export chaperone FliS [Planococcus]|uniref:Flagellar protein FliS n=2 Tax=Planococcus TaxID=1372 RepID=A0A0U2Z680_9BACL|nr:MULTISPECIES: flagellar export chaperone FliS [Planococcus]ALS75387.1 flagellar protein FliS [Planococcus rifietoensis]RLJ86143.1 flagellar protein FliS [Planococcus citreus]
MATINPYQTYQQNSVMTASSEELTLMLYNGCLKFIKLAKKAMLDKQFEEKNKNLLKAQAIIQELRSTLNPDIALSKELEQLYEYQNNSLMEANMKNDAAALDAVLADLTELRNTWKQAMALAKQ